ncbi:MAG: methylthioribulose 1-phosphate dehydratase, partial [Gammaproteobacteria bacterium]|nr:methylthioribulose 1-phosphate dehydratase [Gammaproteobacteria bacterium]
MFEKACEQIIQAGRYLYAQGMVPATSGNFSVRLNHGEIAITVSGRHKGHLTDADVMRVDSNGESLDGQNPSAETLLHTFLYSRFSQINAILHPHSINATVLSRLSGEYVKLNQYELLKAFPGITTHKTSLVVPVFDNDQNIARLARLVDSYIADIDHQVHAYLIRGHGFYTWGESMDDCLRHVEALEFLFACELKQR